MQDKTTSEWYVGDKVILGPITTIEPTPPFLMGLHSCLLRGTLGYKLFLEGRNGKLEMRIEYTAGNYGTMMHAPFDGARIERIMILSGCSSPSSSKGNVPFECSQLVLSCSSSV